MFRAGARASRQMMKCWRPSPDRQARAASWAIRGKSRLLKRGWRVARISVHIWQLPDYFRFTSEAMPQHMPAERGITKRILFAVLGIKSGTGDTPIIFYLDFLERN